MVWQLGAKVYFEKLSMRTSNMACAFFWKRHVFFFLTVIWFDLCKTGTLQNVYLARESKYSWLSCVPCCSNQEKCVDTVALSSSLQPSKALPVSWTVCSNWPKVKQRSRAEQWEKGVKEEEKLNYYIFNPCLLLFPSFPPFCFHLGTESHSSCQILLMCVKHEWSHTVQSLAVHLI